MNAANAPAAAETARTTRRTGAAGGGAGFGSPRFARRRGVGGSGGAMFRKSPWDSPVRPNPPALMAAPAAPPAAAARAAGANRADAGALTDPGRLAAVWRFAPPDLWGAAEEWDGGDGDRGTVGASDRLVRTAARTLGAPLAVLSVVAADELAFVSHVGLPADLAGAGGIPAAEAVCPACVARGETVAVEDAAADPALAGLPVVADLGVRAYLGAPVRPDGRHVVGVLCVADLAPRAWTDDDRASLEDLAGLAGSHLAAFRAAADGRAATDRLAESERRFRDIAESAGEYLWEIDADARFTFLTDPAEAVFGRPVAELIGRRPWEMYDDPGERDRVRAWFAGVRDRREPFRDLVRRSRRPDGTACWVKLSGKPTFAPGGRLTGYRGTGLDVTQQTETSRTLSELTAEADAARRERTDLLERFITDAPAAVAMFDRDMRYLAHSRRWVSEHGLPPGTHLFRRSHYDAFPDQPGRWREVHEACLAGETRRAGDDPFTRADGAAGWLDWHVEPWRDGDGAVGGIIILCDDVTERQTSLKRLQLAVDAADIGTWLWDLRAGVVLADAELCRLFGFPAEASTKGIDPDAFYDAIHPDDHARVAAATQRAYTTGVFDAEYRVRRPPGADDGPDGDDPDGRGGVRWVAGRGKVVRDDDDRPQSFHGAVVDITDRVRAETQLRDAKVAAEASDRAKSEFLANMSHELRTPLTAMLGFTELIAADAEPAGPGDFDPDGPDGVRAHCGTIRRNGEHLLRLINDILDLAKVEAGKMTVDLAPVPVRHLAGELAGLMRPRCDEQGLALNVRFLDADGTPGWDPGAAMGDATRLRQILLNLLGNAVKFTRTGAVTLTVRPAERPAVRPAGRIDGRPDGRGAAEPWLEFAVSDTGPGIAAADLERLFRPFEQADSGPTRAAGGTGLGLSISRRLAERLGGTLTAASSPGRGSTFTLRVPAPAVPADFAAASEPAAGPASKIIAPAAVAARPDPPAAPADDRRPLTGRRVLLAEDTADSRRLLTFFLQKSGAEVECVPDGRAAVDRLAPGGGDGGGNGGRHAGGPAAGFDVVLMDMQMPVLDGYSAARELRARGYAGPIVALTAHAMAGDAEDCLAAGCDAYAAKPIGREALADCVLRAAAGVRDGDPAVPLEPVVY